MQPHALTGEHAHRRDDDGLLLGSLPVGRLGARRRGGRAPRPGTTRPRRRVAVDPLLDDLWAALDMECPQLHRLSLRCGSATGDLLSTFELDHYEDFDIDVDFPVSCVILLADGEAVVLMGNPYLTEYVAGRDYRISAGSFFQALKRERLPRILFENPEIALDENLGSVARRRPWRRGRTREGRRQERLRRCASSRS